MAKIIVVEDDDNFATALRIYLEEERHLVEIIPKGYEAINRLCANECADLVIIDWLLPDISGIEVCRQFREKGGTTPVLMLTGRGSANDKAAGLDAGADDYLVKPFDPTELTARVRALIRRTGSMVGKVLKVRDLELNTSTHCVTKAGQKLILRAKEYMLLELLMRHPNKTFTAEGIVQRIWDSDNSASVDTVRTHIKNLRKKIGDNDSDPIIRSTRGMGYEIVADQHHALDDTTQERVR